MRAVAQRVASARVTVGDEVVGSIGHGLLVYLGVGRDDGREDVQYLAEKVAHLRVFPGEGERMNRDVIDSGGGVLVVSAFTLLADARKGRRPTLESAASPEDAQELYEAFCAALGGFGLRVERGRFRAMMEVHSVNAGPVCVLLDSKRTF